MIFFHYFDVLYLLFKSIPYSYEYTVYEYLYISNDRYIRFLNLNILLYHATMIYQSLSCNTFALFM